MTAAPDTPGSRVAAPARPEHTLGRLPSWIGRAEEADRPTPIPAWAGLLLGLGTLLPLALGCLLFGRWAPAVQDVRLQLAGSRAAAEAVVTGRIGEYRAALRADYWLLGGYSLTLAAVGLLGAYVLGRPRQRLVALAAGGAGLLAGACDLAEDVLLAAGLGRLGPGRAGSDAPFTAATALSTVKWLLLLPAGAIALTIIAVTLSRALRATLSGLRRRPRPKGGGVPPERGDDTDRATGPRPDGDSRPDGDTEPHGDTAGPELIPPWPVATAHDGRWPSGPRAHGPLDHQARWRNGTQVPPGREHARLGFCVSGGGIRSACVTLGALQALRPWLKQARYLVSVSGGGYTVGALQLALSDSAPGCPVHAVSGLTADNVLEPGSPEEDHLRRHGRYLADGAGQWLVALGTLLRGLVAALTLLLAAVLVLGLGLSRFYQLVPLTDLDGLAAVGLRTGGAHPGALGVRPAALYALLGLLVAAAVCWLLWLLAFSLLGWNTLLPRVLRRTSYAALALAALLVLGVLAVPGLAWGAVRLQDELAIGARQTGAGLSLTVLLSYLALLLGILWRGRRAIEHGAAAIGGLLHGARRLGGGLTGGIAQYLVVWAALAALSTGALLALGWAVATGHAWPAAAQVLLPLVLATVGLNLDQTWMSLHPFYRRRLASAFAVRRSTEGGEVLARPYHFFREQTRLTHYGARHPDFPQVIFAAAANLSGSSRTPPGRRAVSFTFSHDYVGGPDVGYARTDLLERRTRRHIARDLTVQSAMAVSGAAFSSAMGRQSRVYQGLFAVTNARLGTWLPNPAALGPLWTAAPDWRRAPQPAVRRLQYQLRELSGRFPMDDRFLLTTDGGHYENLGLVELLRHGVRTAVCVDASGDTAYAATLAAAITLAREELGIVITLHEPELLIPGSAARLPSPSGTRRGDRADGSPDPDDPNRPADPSGTQGADRQPPLRGLAAQLADRLSARAVVTGDIRYPAPLDFGDGGGGSHGTLIVAQAVLTPGMPYELHSYAVANPAFPNDSTSDQWFDHRQFDAYQTLGRYLGEQAVPAVKAALAGHKPAPVPAQPSPQSSAQASTHASSQVSARPSPPPSAPSGGPPAGAPPAGAPGPPPPPGAPPA
ncbi:hypothetical protein [Kitasatospora sp. NPDC088548]|uniref:hypothetical protein n=1 Tax=Kitasatospora sp. NPDC088548 TaxID=3364075 RepID=UPI003826FF28